MLCDQMGIGHIDHFALCLTRKHEHTQSTLNFEDRITPKTFSIEISDRIEGLCDFSQEAINELREIYNEVSKEDWDGYDSEAINADAVIEASKLIRMLPSSLPLPEITIEPDGGIGLEWYKTKGFVFVASVLGENIISYAGLFGPSSEIHGKENFTDTIPTIFLSALNKLFDR